MPFTFSHPAIVLPLKKISGKTLSLTGLVIGSMIPDFEYFIRMKVKSIYSHTLSGIFWFDIPLGLLLTFVYHQIARDEFISNLPKILNKKLTVFKHFDWNAYFRQNWLIVLISITIGAASHLFWDAFTHPAGYFVRKGAWLSREITILNKHIQICRVVQQISSVIGGIIVLIAIFTLSNNQSEQSYRKSKYWLLVSMITAIIFTIRYIAGLDIHIYGDVVVTIISAFLLSLIVTPLLINKRVV